MGRKSKISETSRNLLKGLIALPFAGGLSISSSWITGESLVCIKNDYPNG